jgi:hypothetical protein
MRPRGVPRAATGAGSATGRGRGGAAQPPPHAATTAASAALPCGERSLVGSQGPGRRGNEGGVRERSFLVIVLLDSPGIRFASPEGLDPLDDGPSVQSTPPRYVFGFRA